MGFWFSNRADGGGVSHSDWGSRSERKEGFDSDVENLVSLGHSSGHKVMKLR